MLDILIHGLDMTWVVGNFFYVVLAMIVFDVITGLLVAGKEKRINSSINFEGLIRKAGVIVGLVFLMLVDALMRADGYIIKIGVGLIIVYEGISIIENFSKIGVNLEFLTKYFDRDKVERDVKYDKKDIS